jgi:hypothetical protein
MFHTCYLPLILHSQHVSQLCPHWPTLHPEDEVTFLKWSCQETITPTYPNTSHTNPIILKNWDMCDSILDMLVFMRGYIPPTPWHIPRFNGKCTYSIMYPIMYLTYPKYMSSSGLWPWNFMIYRGSCTDKSQLSRKFWDLSELVWDLYVLRARTYTKSRLNVKKKAANAYKKSPQQPIYRPKPVTQTLISIKRPLFQPMASFFPPLSSISSHLSASAIPRRISSPLLLSVPLFAICLVCLSSLILSSLLFSSLLFSSLLLASL